MWYDNVESGNTSPTSSSASGIPSSTPQPWRARFLDIYLPIENADEVKKCSGYACFVSLEARTKAFHQKKNVFQSPMIDDTLKPKTLIKLITILGFFYIPSPPIPVRSQQQKGTWRAKRSRKSSEQLKSKRSRTRGFWALATGGHVVSGKLTVFLYEKMVIFHSFLYVTYEKMVTCHSFLYVYQRLRKMTLRITIIMGGGWWWWWWLDVPLNQFWE